MENKKYIGMFFLLSLLITFLWFRDGSYLGGGESGLWFFNAARSLSHYTQGWVEIGTGVYIPTFLSFKPLLFIMAAFQQFLSPSVTQGILFLFLIFSGITGMYLLTKECIGKSKNAVFVLSPLFYFFNLFVMTQVWNRHIYSGFFTWSYLPMFLFLWMRWLRSRKVLYFFFILISSIVYPVSFATIAFGITIWIPVGLYVLFELIEHRSDRKVVFRILFQFLIGCTFWVIVNIWWIFPLLTNTASTLLQMGNFDNLAILKGVSQYFKNRDVLLLRQSYYFSENNINEQFRSGFYLSPQAYLLSLIALVFVTIGAFTSFGKKYFKYLTVLLILSWFLIKGANRPFGVEFYGFLFSKLSVLQMFRNPYEKLGLMFVVPYTIFFSLGVHLIGQKLKRFKMLFFGLTIFFICGVLVWPMWTGKVYADFVRLKIPQEYEEINQLINMDKSDVRILNLPPINGEGSRFSWGYEGVVPYDFLFDKPTIARNIFVGSYYQEIFDAFSDSDISKIDATLDNLNIRYLILHKDMDFTFNGSLDPKIVEKIINNSQNFEFITSIGNLSLYKYVSNNVGTRITAFPHVSLEFSYEIKSPTKYVVKVTNAKKPYKLIFKESFHENWEARIGNEKIAQHFKPYDYANGWEISKLGSYDIVIVFKIWPWD